MKVYPTPKIRNIAFIAHGGSGKTTLAEAMLYNTGATNRLGKVDDGNTVSDFLPEEIKRKISISTSLVPCEYRDHKINILDTPGFADFLGEVRAAVKVADNALVVVSAVAGVEVQTEMFWEEAQNLPKIVFVNRMDRENANFYKTLDDLKDKFSGTIVPLQLPIGAEASFKGVVDLLKMKALIFEPGSGKYKEEDIPTDMMAEVESYKEQLIEAAAEGNDDLLVKYLEGEELTDEEIRTGIADAASKGAAVFVFCGSALNNIGVLPVMDFIVDCMAAPRLNDQDMSEVALVFKTIADPYIDANFFKVIREIKADSVVYNAAKRDEKIGRYW